jgi:hypothetical protein
MIHITPTKVLLATTLQPLVVQWSGSLAGTVNLTFSHSIGFSGRGSYRSSKAA